MKKILLKSIIFILLFFLFNISFVWIYNTPERREIKKGTHKKLLKWNAIKNDKKKYNTILLGSSRGYCAYNPVIIDSITNLNSYNMCTGSQNIIESYYILKELLKYQKPKVVIYEIFLPSFSKNPDYFHILSNADFMSNKGKWDLILNGFGNKGLLNIVFPILRYKPYLKKDLKNIFKQTIKSSPDNSYWKNGYLYDDKIVSKIDINNFPPIYSLKNETTDINKNLNKLINLCEENNIRLVCVRAPYPPTRLKKSPTDNVNQFFVKFLNIKNIPFYDFNYGEIKKYNDYDFTDLHHMNNLGANKVSKELSKILNKEKRYINNN